MGEVEYTELYLGDFLIQEPVTAITDLLTASVCIISFFALQKINVLDKAYNYLKFYLLFMGLGTLCAAFFSHAIVYLTGHNFRIIGWSFSAIGIYCIENAALFYFQKEHKKRVAFNSLNIVFKVQLILFFILLAIPEMRVFRLVQVNAALGIGLISLPLFSYLHFNMNKLGYSKVFYALLLSIIPGLTFNFEITLHKYFNYHDLSHVLMAIAMLSLYFGIRQVGLEMKNIVKLT